MKKLILSAAIALFAVSAFAQNNNAKDKQKAPKDRTDKTAKVKEEKEKFDNSSYDLNNDGIFSPEERQARKAEKIARKETRKADKDDDGILNGSADRDNHGSVVSATAKGTTYKGKEKGEAVSDVARTNGKSAERIQGGGSTARPAKAAKPAGAGKPAGVGRKN